MANLRDTIYDAGYSKSITEFPRFRLLLFVSFALFLMRFWWNHHVTLHQTKPNRTKQSQTKGRIKPTVYTVYRTHTQMPDESGESFESFESCGGVPGHKDFGHLAAAARNLINTLLGTNWNLVSRMAKRGAKQTLTRRSAKEAEISKEKRLHCEKNY